MCTSEPERASRAARAEPSARPSVRFLDRTLARRLEACDGACAVAHVRARRALEPLFTGDVLAVAGGWAVHSGPGSPINFAVGIGLDGPVAESQFASIERFFEARAAAPSFKLCPLADPTLWALLRARGYAPVAFLSAWVRELADAPDQPRPPGVRIEAVTAAREAVWAETVTCGFSGRRPPTDADRAFLAGFWASPGTTAFLLTCDGVPAAAGALFVHAGIGMLFNAATLPAHRGHGYQQLLIAHRLQAARRLGADLAFVQAAPGDASARNIERSGFRLAYTKLLVER